MVSVIGDSTFLHSGLTGIAEMVYNRPKTGHVVLILDNATTAMTGLQEHPGTGRHIDMSPAPAIRLEEVCRAMGVDRVDAVDPVQEHDRYAELLRERLASDDVSVIIARRPCLLQMKKLQKYKKAMEAAR